MEQGTSEWHEARLGNLTGSRMGDLMKKARNDYAYELAGERLSGRVKLGGMSGPMRRAQELEPRARIAYEMTRGVDVEKVGFLLHPTIERFGASPDGLVGDHGGIEIKCPDTKKHLAMMVEGPSKIDPDWHWQVWANLAVTGRSWWDFVSYDDRLPGEDQLWVYRFDRDFEKIAVVHAEAKSFLSEVAQIEANLRDKRNA